ncbi:exodeoxyribonuclease VII small subunit [uncultured Adlercreutzia sp.]|uniref:exodeoxyribonuclease VII small subunit n=1 Tax=uncultured Adlercreutzia sp. TaxID=875803 RepID=UPI0025F61097|nr:exodeoxyribonuclease VII small subunit [uncultured Adlercreutzia sp.]MCI9261325.1 exodeoxyribonuclease VII small subunit [Eggerthellaceae bacterium]
MAEQRGSAFGEVQERLNQIVDEVSAEDTSLDDALKLYEEAVKLGLSACDLSEQDIEAHLAAEEPSSAEDASPSEGEVVDGGTGAIDAGATDADGSPSAPAPLSSPSESTSEAPTV